MNTNTQTNQGMIKRVPLDFSWPIGKSWPGHTNPYTHKQIACKACDGTGSTVARLRLNDIVNYLLLSGEEAAKGEVSISSQLNPNFCNIYKKVPGNEMVLLTEGLAGRPMGPMQHHDALDRRAAVRKIISAAGLPGNWGYCPVCNGEGEVFANDEDKQASEAWVPEQPPAGEGYQLWENFVPGAPISQVFSDPEEFALYLANSQTNTQLTHENWLKVIKGELFIKG